MVKVEPGHSTLGLLLGVTLVDPLYLPFSCEGSESCAERRHAVRSLLQVVLEALAGAILVTVTFDKTHREDPSWFLCRQRQTVLFLLSPMLSPCFCPVQVLFWWLPAAQKAAGVKLGEVDSR